mmetsp:Transcript_15957/g.38063  ORF Transcript_15957/g.38063 Transcript_15957/m.38063 type:complete len:210 (+) Transcript_15957:692-1321(+)
MDTRGQRGSGVGGCGIVLLFLLVLLLSLLRAFLVLRVSLLLLVVVVLLLRVSLSLLVVADLFGVGVGRVLGLGRGGWGLWCGRLRRWCGRLRVCGVLLGLGRLRRLSSHSRLHTRRSLCSDDSSTLELNTTVAPRSTTAPVERDVSVGGRRMTRTRPRARTRARTGPRTRCTLAGRGRGPPSRRATLDLLLHHGLTALRVVHTLVVLPP